MNTVNGISGVNGVFECPKDYSACGWKNYTINERYVQGEKKATYKSTGDRVVFGWNDQIEPFLFQTDLINANDEDEIFEWFANHPLILMNGESQLHKYYEKGLINNKMKARATKNFICSDQDWLHIYFWLVYNISIDAMPEALKDLGCWNAINLDAGLSTSFVYNNKYIIWPQREILDWVFVSPKNVDIISLNATSKKFISWLLKSLSNKTSKQKITKLQNISDILEEYIIQVYAKNTTDIIEYSDIISDTLIYENFLEDEAAQDFLKTPDFIDASNNYFVEWDSIYKREITGRNETTVWTRIEFTSNKTIKNVALVNSIREYLKAIIPVYQKIQELESLERLDDRLDIEVSL